MSKLFLIIFLFVLSSCGDNSPRQVFLPPDKKDINEIVAAVINRDSLVFTKKPATDPNPIPLLVDLRKIRVILTDTADVPQPMDLTTVSIFDLFNSLVNNQRFFSRTDSSYFLFQNDSVKTYTIDKIIAEKLAYTTTLVEQQQKHESNKSTSYYDLTIPIFSADNKRAYIVWTTNCLGCGGATAFYLEKINGEWTIVGFQILWET